MWRFILDLDDTLAYTTRDLKGDPKLIPELQPVEGALEFLSKHWGACILLTAGDKSEQWKKIKVLRMRWCFKKIFVVPDPKDKLEKLTEIIRKLENQPFSVKPHNIIVIGDRLDTEIRRGNELECVTVRVKIPGGRHSNEMPKGAFKEVPHFTVKDFEELLEIFPF